jgi:MFS family permease
VARDLPTLTRDLQDHHRRGLQALSQAVLLEEFSPKEKGKAIAFWSLGIIAAPILGPAAARTVIPNIIFRHLPAKCLNLWTDLWK